MLQAKKYTQVKEHVYDKMKSELLATNYFSSSFIEKAQGLKQQDEVAYLKKVDAIQDYLLNRINSGDMVAYALFYVAHEDKLSSLSELHDFKKVLGYLSQHGSSDVDNVGPYFDPEVKYYSDCLGHHPELWSAE
jgi:hypothetical protein